MQTEPTKTVWITLWTPNLVTPDRGNATGTFDNNRQRTERKIGGVIQGGGYTKSTRSESNQVTTKSTSTDLSQPDGTTGSDVWKSQVQYKTSVDRSEGQEVVAGAWNEIQMRFNDSVSSDVLQGSHNKDLTTSSGGSQTEIKVRDFVTKQYEDDWIRGRRGRGVNTLRETITTDVDATGYTKTVFSPPPPQQAGGGGDGAIAVSISTNWDTTTDSKLKSYVKREFDWDNGSRRYLSANIDVTKTRHTVAHTHTDGRGGPNSWIDETVTTDNDFELVVNGAVGQVNGMQKEYFHAVTVVKDAEHPSGRTTSDIASGSPYRVAVSPPQIRWWDDTWANAAWNLTAESRFGDYARIAFGTVDVIVGVGMAWTGAGLLPGGVLVAVGLDQIATGSMNLRYGRVNQGFSIIEFGVYSATGNETLAFLTPGILSLGFGSAGSFGRAGFRASAFGVIDPVVDASHLNNAFKFFQYTHVGAENFLAYRVLLRPGVDWVITREILREVFAGFAGNTRVLNGLNSPLGVAYNFLDFLREIKSVNSVRILSAADSAILQSMPNVMQFLAAMRRVSGPIHTADTLHASYGAGLGIIYLADRKFASWFSNSFANGSRWRAFKLGTFGEFEVLSLKEFARRLGIPH